MPTKPDLSADHLARLQRIAEALDLPVQAFFDAPSPIGDEDLATLLRLWSAVGEIQARRRILSCLRQEARRTGYEEAP